VARAVERRAPDGAVLEEELGLRDAPRAAGPARRDPPDEREEARRPFAPARAERAEQGERERREPELEPELDGHRARADEPGEDVVVGALEVVDGARAEEGERHDLAVAEAAHGPLRRGDRPAERRGGGADGGLP